MTANLLTPNSSETESLLIGLPHNLPKLIPAHLSLLTLLATLFLSLMNTLLSLLSLNLAVIIFMNVAYSSLSWL